MYSLCFLFISNQKKKKHTKVHGFSLFLLPRETMSLCGWFLTSVHVPANDHLPENENVKKKKKKKRRFCYYTFPFARYLDSHAFRYVIKSLTIKHILEKIFNSLSYLIWMKLDSISFFPWKYTQRAPFRKKICSEAAFAFVRAEKTFIFCCKNGFWQTSITYAYAVHSFEVQSQSSKFNKINTCWILLSSI